VEKPPKLCESYGSFCALSHRLVSPIPLPFFKKPPIIPLPFFKKCIPFFSLLRIAMLQKIAIRTGACYLCIEKNVNSQKTKGQVI